MLKTDQIKIRLAGHQPSLISAKGHRHAAVAMLLFQGEAGPEVLLIRRTDYEGDPWSGDVAFPGGGLEEQDAGPRQAAERETREEIGLSLQPEEYLGRLDDLLGAYLPVTISCFVYQLQERPELKLNAEVVDTFWILLHELQSPERNQQACFEYRGKTRNHPIIRLDGYCDRFLWGITYRLLQSFFSLTGDTDQTNNY